MNTLVHHSSKGEGEAPRYRGEQHWLSPSTGASPSRRTLSAYLTRGVIEHTVSDWGSPPPLLNATVPFPVVLNDHKQPAWAAGADA